MTLGFQNRFDIGQVITRTFGAIGANAATFAGLALLLAGVPTLITSIGAWGIQSRLMGAFRASDYAFGGIGLETTMLTTLGPILGFVGGAVLQVAVIYGAAAYLNGRRAGFGECLSAGFRRCLPLIVMNVIGFVAIGFGLMIFIVPGVIMILAWSVAAPALVVERTGVFGAFSRSADLTRGRRFGIFGLLLICVVAFVVAQNLLTALFLGFASSVWMGGMVLAPMNALLGTAFSIVVTTGIATLYYQLRNILEGLGPELFASVFD